MKQFVLGFLTLIISSVYAQTAPIEGNSDEFYLEDQFYMGITYNLMLDKPEGVTQRSLSYGLQGGFIKDLPLNADRTVALGLGLGYAVNSYYSNIVASDTGSQVVYSLILDEMNVKRSKFETHLIEMPFEFRWRNSSPEEYRFWRVYSGIKLGYVFGSRSKLVSENDKSSFVNPEVRKFQYGLVFNFGYHTFNVHVYYALNNFLNDGTFMGSEEIAIKPLRVGLIFYIL